MANFFEDTFTGTQDIPDHVPEIGYDGAATWQNTTGEMEVAGGFVTPKAGYTVAGCNYGLSYNVYGNPASFELNFVYKTGGSVAAGSESMYIYLYCNGNTFILRLEPSGAGTWTLYWDDEYTSSGGAAVVVAANTEYAGTITHQHDATSELVFLGQSLARSAALDSNTNGLTEIRLQLPETQKFSSVAAQAWPIPIVPIVPTVPQAWLSALQALLPPGRAFTREPGSTLAKLLEAFAAMFKGTQDTLEEVALEADPRFANDESMLIEWERLLGLPDACTEPVQQLLVPGVYPEGTYDLVSFTRAGDATVVDENGIVQTMGPDLPLYDHDVGSLIGEAPGRNLALWSESLTKASYSKSGLAITDAAYTTSQGVDLSLCLVVSTPVNLFQARVANSSVMTFSMYVKAGAISGLRRFNLRNQTAGVNVLAVYFDAVSGDLTYYIGAVGAAAVMVEAGVWRLTMTSAAFVPGDQVWFYPGFVGGAETVGHSVYIGGVQIEAGAFATSYIRTMGSEVARLARYALRGLLINRAATNVCKQSHALTTAPWVAGTVAATLASATGLGLPFFRLAKTTAAMDEAFHQVLRAVAANEVWSGTCLLMASSSNEVSLGLWSDAVEGWGPDADSSAVILLGPGVVVQLTGNLHAVTGLSYTEPTLLSFTRTFRQAGNMRLTIYPARNTSSTIGKSNLVTRAMVVAGADSGGSYIPTTTMNVARAADVAYVDVPQTLERRARAFARLTEQGGQSRQYFIDLAAALGEPGCTITEYRPMNCNSDCNDALYSEADIFTWRMNIPHSNAGARPMNCNDDCNDPLDLGGASPIECPIRERAPAHTSVLFAYSA